ncbi:MAG: CAP domain-containing protein [Lachnospiraceae bacterium]|nr:CAP domain-containing protein [Lachnospiraceae bacterium]
MKKFTGLPILLSICMVAGAVLMPETSEHRISSVMRRFIIGSEEDAIYVASASEEVPVPEQKTVSGNTLGSLSIEAGEVFTQVNQARAEIGLPELVWSDELAAAAEVRAQEIHQAFSHTRPDGSPWWTANSELIYGENIAKGYQSADSVVTAWMESSDHKDNILYSGFQTIGVAVYSVDGKWYWAQEFGY